LKRYAAYTRSAGDDSGNELQLSAASAFLNNCLEKGKQVTLAHYADTFDLGLNIQRAELSALRAAADRGEVDVLIISDYSRLARRREDLLDLTGFFEQREVTIIALDQSSCRCRLTSRHHDLLLAAMFQYEDELITAARLRGVSEPCSVCRAIELQSCGGNCHV
jgi:DNA invertase Pin-like site-specific DNA recombinase